MPYDVNVYTPSMNGFFLSLKHTKVKISKQEIAQYNYIIPKDGC